MATTTTNLKLTKPAVSDAADIAVLNANFDKIDEKCNPALFAPSGYGLGTDAYSLPYLSDANDYKAMRNGWYRVDASTANGPGVSGVLRVESYNEAWSTCQTFYSTSWSSAYPALLQRWHRNDNGWDASWAWVNPPTKAGIVYKTTELYDGKPVYTKLIDIGYLPNASTKNIDGVIESGIEDLVEMKCILKSGYVRRNGDGLVGVHLGVDNPYAWLTINTTTDMSAYTGKVMIKWTRP